MGGLRQIQTNLRSLTYDSQPIHAYMVYKSHGIIGGGGKQHCLKYDEGRGGKHHISSEQPTASYANP